MPSPGVSLRPRQGPQAPGSGSSPFPESTHQTQGHAHRLCSLPTPGAPQKPRTGPLLTTVLLIRPIPAVVRAVALAPDPQADAVVLAAEGPVWRAHEPGCSGERTESESALGVPHPGWGPPGSRRAPPRPAWSPAPPLPPRLEPRPSPPRPARPHREPHRTPLGSRLSCPRSRPRRRISRPAACTGYCCTGIRQGGRSALGAGGSKESRQSSEPPATGGGVLWPDPSLQGRGLEGTPGKQWNRHGIESGG